MRKRLVFSTVLGLGLLVALIVSFAAPVAAQGGQPGRLDWAHNTPWSPGSVWRVTLP